MSSEKSKSPQPGKPSRKPTLPALPAGQGKPRLKVEKEKTPPASTQQ